MLGIVVVGKFALIYHLLVIGASGNFSREGLPAAQTSHLFK
jgi:hypothetical protein